PDSSGTLIAATSAAAASAGRIQFDSTAIGLTSDRRRTSSLPARAMIAATSSSRCASSGSSALRSSRSSIAAFLPSRVSEHLPQCPPREEQVRAHRTFRYAQLHRDLATAIPLQTVHQHHPPLHLRQRAQRRLQSTPQLLTVVVPPRIPARRRTPRMLQRLRLPDPLPAPHRPRTVPHDPPQPAAERRRIPAFLQT